LSDRAVRARWASLQRPEQAALVAYLTAGYPDRATSLAALRLAARHADILEVGVPFSDPVADGPVIQRASFEALAGGMSLRGTLDLVAEANLDRPVVLFSYLNPLLRYGFDRLLADAAAVGIDGLLVTDLPAGALVLHSCDNPACCNWRHLRVGTHRENQMDAVARGRWTYTPPTRPRTYCDPVQHGASIEA